MRKNMILSFVVVMEVLLSLMLIDLHISQNDVDMRAYSEEIISYPDYHNATNLSFTGDSLGILYSAWDEFDDGTQRWQIHISVSEDDGTTWSGSLKDIPVTDGEYDAKQPGVLGGKEKTVYLAWSEYSTATGSREIFFQKSNDVGNSWNGLTQITKSSDNGLDFTNPMLANDTQGVLYGVWNGADPNNNYHQEIYFGYSQDDGSSWSSTEVTKCISNENIKSDSSKPFILVSRFGDIFVFWTKYIVDTDSIEVFASHSRDGGVSWSIENVSYPGYANAYNVSAVEYGGKIYAFWEQEISEKGKLRREIAYSYYNGDSRSGVNGDLIISYPDGYNATNPSPCAYSKIMVVWSEFDEKTGYKQLMISNSTDGSQWTGTNEDVVITDKPGNHLQPVAIVSNGEMHVVWSMWNSYGKPRGSREIFTLSTGQIPEFPAVFVLPAIAAVSAFIKREKLLG